jgi:hypothetical protein
MSWKINWPRKTILSANNFFVPRWSALGHSAQARIKSDLDQGGFDPMHGRAWFFDHCAWFLGR